MKWRKKGRIFNPVDNPSNWITNYAALPVADMMEDDKLRIYFSTRDRQGRSLPTYLDTAADNPKKIIHIHGSPILQLGRQGTFDDNGIMPSWVLNVGTRKMLYYIGWNPQKTVSYRLSIGLAISEDNGQSYQKYSEGPILDRDVDEPFFNTAPCVIEVNGSFFMWYVSCTGWEMVNDWPEPYYNIKCATSKDGIRWKRQNKTCIGYDHFTQAIGKPCVFIEKDEFHMIYSYRNITDYRTDRTKSYRLGYATSKNGIDWERQDDNVGITMSDAGWDSVMNEYATTYQYRGKRYLIYNGNGFGQTGFGYAEMSVI